jgi:hypothetical protein
LRIEDYYGEAMSKKHNQRTRAEILAKRQIDPATWIEPVRKIVMGVPGPALPSQPNASVRKASRSKYTPHTGAKEVERAKRCRMDFLHGPHAVYNDNERSAPTLCQLSKVDHALQSLQRMYDSMF